MRVGHAGAVGAAAGGSEATTPAGGLSGEPLPNNHPGAGHRDVEGELPPGPGVNPPAPQTATPQPLEEIKR